MKIAIASDHAGYKYKEELKKHLQAKKHEVVDFGTDSEEPCDYPDFVFPAAGAVANGECDKGIVLGGSGNGEAMTANKVKGIRCAVCWNVESAKLAASHNNANMISIGQRMMDLKTAIDIVDTWLSTPFEGGRHVPRIKKMEEKSW
ncbi:MAG TPA: ribose 5-phosphate isomerase B [Candidatus Goldiibacteriota bacterium]|nr:ribose 5-phosphate isomerase B [Candidatus Goldiibacteriota bacterium]